MSIFSNIMESAAVGGVLGGAAGTLLSDKSMGATQMDAGVGAAMGTLIGGGLGIILTLIEEEDEEDGY